MMLPFSQFSMIKVIILTYHLLIITIRYFAYDSILSIKKNIVKIIFPFVASSLSLHLHTA